MFNDMHIFKTFLLYFYWQCKVFHLNRFPYKLKCSKILGIHFHSLKFPPQYIFSQALSSRRLRAIIIIIQCSETSQTNQTIPITHINFTVHVPDHECPSHGLLWHDCSICYYVPEDPPKITHGFVLSHPTFTFIPVFLLHPQLQS